MSIVRMPEIKATGSPEFEEIFNEYSRFVYRTAYAVTGRHEDAEDVLQTIFFTRQFKFGQRHRNPPHDQRWRPAARADWSALRWTSRVCPVSRASRGLASKR